MNAINYKLKCNKLPINVTKNIPNCKHNCTLETEGLGILHPLANFSSWPFFVQRHCIQESPEAPSTWRRPWTQQFKISMILWYDFSIISLQASFTYAKLAFLSPNGPASLCGYSIKTMIMVTTVLGCFSFPGLNSQQSTCGKMSKDNLCINPS